MESKLNTKASLGIGFGIIVAVLIQQILIPKVFSPSFDSQLMKLSSEINKNCPFMIDSETRLDNTFGGAGKSIAYNYTLINLLKSDIDIDYFESLMKPQILNNIKTNPDLKLFRDNDVSFIYNYNDKSSARVTTIKFTPNDYK